MSAAPDPALPPAAAPETRDTPRGLGSGAEGVLGAHVDRLGGMLVSPRRTIRRLLSEDRGGLGGILLWLVVLIASTSPVRTGRALLVARTGLVDGALQFLVFLQPRLLPLLLAVAVAAALMVLVGGRGGLSYGRALDVASYLLVPAMLLMAVGTILSTLGLELWFLPHRTLRGSIGQRATYIAVSFGWSLVLLALTLAELRRWPPAPAPASTDR